MRLVILAAAVFFEFSTYARATAILGVWYPTFVFIGADGREVISNAPPSNGTCKTSVVGEIAVAEAGWLEGGDGNITIKIDTLIREELSKDGMASDRVARAERVVFDNFKWMDDQRKILGLAYIVPGSGSELLFAYKDGNAMAVDDYAVFLDESVDGIVEHKIHCPSAECGVGAALPLGRKEEIRQIMRSDPALQTMPRFSDRIRYVIQRVAERFPDEVGGPISILKITPDGSHEWIDNGNCHDSN
jgi:hypothetical protein